MTAAKLCVYIQIDSGQWPEQISPATLVTIIKIKPFYFNLFRYVYINQGNKVLVAEGRDTWLRVPFSVWPTDMTG